MALTPGTRLGVYDITAQIGEGGMGQVWRATDTTLGRQVAIKILPEAFAADPERLARFEREAKTLAALNHPHIAAIYGFEKSAGTYALVMELVEGEDLSQRIARGAVPIDEALPIARQIAEALEAAHEQGIIHRDLKPANIKLRPDGTVKVLDFGLAKALDPAAASSPDAMNSPTITTPAMTQAGMILGTAAYMSPEQARGKVVDKRTDVWAFGAVLYEMLSGVRPFTGEDSTEVIAAVVKTTPDWSALPADVPRSLVTLIQRCLEKDRKARVGDIAVARFLLADIAALGGSTPVAASPAARPTSVTARALPWVMAAALAVVAFVAGARWMARPPEPRQVIRMTHVPAGGNSVRSSTRRNLALSPDGRHLTYLGTSGLYLRALDSMDERVISGTDSLVSNPVFSPDGQSLAYWQNGQLRRIAVAGGGSIALAAAATNPVGVSWEADGTILFGQPDGLWRVSENGGEPARLIATESQMPINPQRLPGGDWVLFSLTGEDADQQQIVVESLTSKERRVLRRGASSGRYVSTGHLLYLSEGVLTAVPFDVDRLEVTGGPAPVVEGLRRTIGVFARVGLFDVSANGTLLYVPGPPRDDLTNTVAVADRAGAVSRVGLPGRYQHVRVAPDGARLAIDSDDGKEAIVWVYDLSGTSAMRRLTFGGRNQFPVWSPDGRRIAFQSDREGSLAVYAQPVDGTGAAERLTTPDAGDAHVPESWSPDGRYLTVSVVKGALSSLWVLSVADGTLTRFGDVQSAQPIGSVISPDGRWVAYHVRLTGAATRAANAGIFVEPFPVNRTGARNQAPRVELDFQPVWSPNGRELFYIGSTASGRLQAVRVAATAGLTFNNPESLPFALTAGRLSDARRPFDVLPDGRFVGLVAGSGEEASALPELRLVINWFEEVKRLVPVP